MNSSMLNVNILLVLLTTRKDEGCSICLRMLKIFSLKLVIGVIYD